MKLVFEPVTKTTKNTSEDLTKTLMLTSKENNKALENLNNKLLEKLNDILTSPLLPLLSKITNLENTSGFKLLQDPQSISVNDLLMNKTIPVTLYYNLLTFRDTDKKFELHGDVLEMMTNIISIVDLAI